jgi:hypothetical protein
VRGDLNVCRDEEGWDLVGARPDDVDTVMNSARTNRESPNNRKSNSRTTDERCHVALCLSITITERHRAMIHDPDPFPQVNSHIIHQSATAEDHSVAVLYWDHREFRGQLTCSRSWYSRALSFVCLLWAWRLRRSHHALSTACERRHVKTKLSPHPISCEGATNIFKFQSG